MSEKNVQPVEGNVTEIGFACGRCGLVALTLDPWLGGPRQWVEIPLDLVSPETDVEVDGKKITFPDNRLLVEYLLAYLYTTRCRARLYCRLTHYGSAVRAEFTTIPKE